MAEAQGYTGWDYDTASTGGQKLDKKSFTKLTEGVTIIRILDDAPYMRWTHWMPQFSRKATCPGFGCPIDKMIKTQKEAGLTATYSNAKTFALNIYNHNTEKAEIFEIGKTFIDDLKIIMEDLREEGLSLKDAKLKVRMTKGSDGKAVYRIDILERTAMDEKENQAFLNKTDFLEYFKPQTPEQLQQLLAVQSDFKDAWIKIVYGNNDEQTEELGLVVEE